MHSWSTKATAVWIVVGTPSTGVCLMLGGSVEASIPTSSQEEKLVIREPTASEIATGQVLYHTLTAYKGVGHVLDPGGVCERSIRNQTLKALDDVDTFFISHHNMHDIQYRTTPTTASGSAATTDVSIDLPGRAPAARHNSSPFV